MQGRAGHVMGMPEHHVTVDDSQFVGESRGFERRTPLQTAAEADGISKRDTYLFSMGIL